MADALRKIPLPTIDRPFGIELWPFFDHAYSKLVGYPPTKFVFIPGVTPLSTLASCAGILITYYITIFAGREAMKNVRPFNLNGLFMVHNLYLTVISAILLVLFVEQLVPTVWRNGIFFSICDHRGGWTPPLVTLYYVRLRGGVLLAVSADITLAKLPDQIS